MRTLNDSLWKIYPENVVVLSTGHHWTSHRVRPGFTPPDLEGYRQNWAHISDIIKQHQKISMELYSMDVYFVVRTIEPRHFQGGEWDQGGTCGGFHDSLSGRWPSGENHNQYHVADSMSQIIRRELYQLDNKTGILDITELTQQRADAHIAEMPHQKGSDCSHYCILGPPMTWSVLLNSMLCAGPSFDFDPSTTVCASCSTQSRICQRL